MKSKRPKAISPATSRSYPSSRTEDDMKETVFALQIAAYWNIVEIHLSTLNGLHVIPADERDQGNVLQSTIRGRCELPGRLPLHHRRMAIVDADARTRWNR